MHRRDSILGAGFWLGFLMFIAPNTKPGYGSRFRDSGHLLLAALLLMALMVIAAVYEAPRIVQQMKRDREEEMIHRGTEYARAIKKFYKKFGRYPTSLEQLENTNNIRFLRKRYKDPLKKDGKWTLLHYGDIAMMLSASAPGASATSLASGAQGSAGTPLGQPSSSGFGSSTSGPTTSGGFGTSSFGSNTQSGIFNQPQAQQSPTSSSGFGASSGFGTAGSQGSSSAAGPSTSGFGSNQSSGFGSSSSSTGTGNSAGLGSQSSQGGLGQTFGAGAIVGVASTSKDPTIRIYNKKKTYNEWQFIYNPQMDQQNALLRGPYSPSTLVSNTNIGTPAGQLNQQNQQSPFGQSSGFGNQQPSGSGNQQLTPGGQRFPPDQNH